VVCGGEVHPQESRLPHGRSAQGQRIREEHRREVRPGTAPARARSPSAGPARRPTLMPPPSVHAQPYAPRPPGGSLSARPSKRAMDLDQPPPRHAPTPRGA
jgi:hypothetical protein